MSDEITVSDPIEPSNEPNEQPIAEGAVATPNASAISDNFARLMERERSIRQKESQLKELEELRAFKEKYAGLLGDVPADAGPPSPKPTKQGADPDLREQLTAIQRKMEEREAQEAKAREAAEWAAIEEDHVRWADEQDKFPLLKAMGAGRLLHQRAVQEYQATGELSSYEPLAEAIEAELMAIAQKAYPVVAKLQDKPEIRAPEARPQTLSNRLAEADTRTDIGQDYDFTYGGRSKLISDIISDMEG